MNGTGSAGGTVPWVPDEWHSAIKWSATLVEPLMPLHQRSQCSEEFRQTVAAHRRWAVLFFAGVVSDMVTTFPENDPWRDATVVNGKPTIDNRRFGTLRDHQDLIPAMSPDPSTDAAVSAVLDDLDERSAAMIVIAQFSDDPDALFRVGTEAVRISVFRRRCLMGLLDAYAVDTCRWWAQEGYRLEVGETDQAQLDAFSEERIEHEFVSEDQYVADREWLDNRLRDLNP